MTTTKHTQFLDLTNGEGGEPQSHDDTEEGMEGMSSGAELAACDGSASTEGSHSMLYETTPHSSGLKSMAIDPSTPGRVVESGQEQTGRWTKEEHEAFLSALKMYGKEWKKVAAKVKTRTVVQTRTHAQKYFQKLQKTVGSTGSDEYLDVDMGVSTEVKRASSVKKKLKLGTTDHPIAAPSEMPLPVPKISRRSSSTTIHAAQVISGLSNASKSSIGPFVTAGSSVTMSGAPLHGFSSSAPSESPFTSWIAGTGRSGPPAIKISAPDPTSSLQQGFPEPSPAATGKRKLAEIAAARMLAGVAGKTPPPAMNDGPPTPPPEIKPNLSLKHAPAIPPLFSTEEIGKKELIRPSPLSLHIVNPESLGITFNQKSSRRTEGEGSPVTPWEGQLKALVENKDAKKLDVAESNSVSSPVQISARVRSAIVTTSEDPYPVCGPGTAYGRNELHKAVCDFDLDGLSAFLNDTTGEFTRMVDSVDDAGFSPLHTACALCLKGNEPVRAAAVNDIVRKLLQAGASVHQTDSNGNTPLHWAARSGDRNILSQLIYKHATLDPKNHKGETPLHWATRAGYRGMDAVVLLIDSGARASLTDHTFKRPIDVSAEGFVDEEGSLANLRSRDIPGKKMNDKDLKRIKKETIVERKEVRANIFIHSPQSRSLVLHHPECLEHHPKSSSDWEAPSRITSIMRRVLPSSDPAGNTETSGIFPHEVAISKEFERASLDLLSRIHSAEYLNFVNSLSKDLMNQLKKTDGANDDESDSAPRPPVVPFTPMVQRSMIKVDESDVKLSVNSDTSFSVGSLKAARRAAGAVQHAVDCVLVGRHRNAFCVVRPPGHHAGINGLLAGGESCGFCIFNNVAAGALYAISDDRLLCKRCAIVDIDVHHGNGTEEIVRKYHDPSKLFFFSIHLYDNDKKKGKAPSYKFYPGTGAEDDLALNIINVPIIPLWKESPPAPAPVKTHNTRNKLRAASEKVDSRSAQESTEDSPSETGGRAAGAGSDAASETGSTNQPTPSPRQSNGFSGRLAYRQAIQTRLLPALRAFNPDLILISAGFDACKGDVGNARHERGGEKMGLDLEPEDYAWTTRKILEIADICCHGRVVSVLEGGYGRTPVVPGAENTLDRTVFAECAVRHLQALIDPYDAEQRFCFK